MSDADILRSRLWSAHVVSSGVLDDVRRVIATNPGAAADPEALLDAAEALAEALAALSAALRKEGRHG